MRLFVCWAGNESAEIAGVPGRGSHNFWIDRASLDLSLLSRESKQEIQLIWAGVKH